MCENVLHFNKYLLHCEEERRNETSTLTLPQVESSEDIYRAGSLWIKRASQLNVEIQLTHTSHFQASEEWFFSFPHQGLLYYYFPRGAIALEDFVYENKTCISRS